MKNNIILISLYSYDSFGIRILHSILKDKGINSNAIFFKELIWNKIDDPTEKELDLLISKLKEFNPILIGISVRSPFIDAAIKVTKRIKENIDCKIIWGGSHAIICPEDCINYSDLVCIGEGEEVIFEVIDKLLKNKSLDNVSGLWIKKDNKIIKNPLKNLIQNLDSLPLPDFENSNKFYIDRNKLHNGDPILGYSRYITMASRGCPNQCTYCSNSILKSIFKDKGGFIRKRSVKHVIDELAHVKNNFKSLKEVAFVDEVFVTDKVWLNEFLKEYTKKINLPFYCEFYPNFVNEEIISILSKAGLVGVTMGIQSGSDRTRNEIYNRYTTHNTIINATNIFKKYNIKATYDVILDNPLEDEEDLKRTLHLLLNIKGSFDFKLYSLVHLPKTKLTERLKKEGLIKEENVSRKALKQWRMTFGYERDNTTLFWNSLITLTSKNFVPRSFIKFISNRTFLKKHPAPIAVLSQGSNYSKLFLTGIKLIIKRQISYDQFKRYVKNLRGISN